MKKIILLYSIAFIVHHEAGAQSSFKKISNIPFSETTEQPLLMDVYMPVHSKQRAIIVVAGSAWGFVYPPTYNPAELKNDFYYDSNYMKKWAPVLVDSGYTVFIISHRFTPKYQYKDIISDCRKAVRYIRYHAAEYKIDPNHIGAMGQSSGGNLMAMLGVSDTVFAENAAAIDKVSSKVQAVVTLAAPFNLADLNAVEDTVTDIPFVLSVLGAYLGTNPDTTIGVQPKLEGPYKQASPYAYISKDDAPMMIVYSDDDPLIPVRQATSMYTQLRKNNVPASIEKIHKADHYPMPDMKEVIAWFDRYLKVELKIKN